MKMGNCKKSIAILLSVSLLLGGHASDVGFLYASNASNDDIQNVITEDTSTFSNADEEEVFEEGEECLEEENVPNDTLVEELSSDEKESVENDAEEVSTESNAIKIFNEEIEDENIASESETNEIEESESVKEEEETTTVVSLDIDVASISILKNEVVTEEENKEQEATLSEAMIEFYKRDNFGFIPFGEPFPVVKKKNNGLLKAESPLPSSYDNREEIGANNLPVLPAVKNQAPYGTCWAFSALGLIEASARKKGVLVTDEDSMLSEAAASYFYFNMKDVHEGSTNTDKPFLQGVDYNKPMNNVDWRNSGGRQDYALMFMSNQVGIVKEDDNTKYSVMENIGLGGDKLDNKYAYKKGVAEIENIYFINKANTDLIKKAIMDYGSVGIAYYSPPFGMGGLYKQDENGEWYMYDNEGTSQENHAVNIVGWDDNVPKNKFPTDPEGNGAWLIRQSWGEDGEFTKDGYFWMSYYNKSLYFDTIAVDTREPNKYKYNYHYDSTGNTYDYMSVGKYSTETNRINDMNQNNPIVGNIFKVTGEENQALEAVQVALQSANSHFNLKIYTKDTQMAHPEDGTMQYEKEMNIDIPGLHTIPLDTKVPFALGTYYSIVLEAYPYENGINVYCDATFKITQQGGKADHYNYVDANQSYTKEKRDGNQYWINTFNGEHYKQREGFSSLYDFNYRIRGLANPGVGVFYDANGGEGTEIEKQEVITGAHVVIKNNTYTKTGYKFVSWNTKKNGTGTTIQEGEDYIVNDYTQLFAQWAPINYTIKFDPGELDSIDSVTRTCTYDLMVDLSTPSNFEDPCKDLIGWTKIQNSATVQYQIGQDDIKNLTTTENEEIILYAIWKQATYKIIYDDNGGDDNEHIKQVEIKINENANIIENPFNKTGHSFLKWNTKADGSGEDYEVNAEVFNLVNKHEEFVLYAKWEPNKYFLSFSSPKSAHEPSNREKTYGVPIVLPIPDDTYLNDSKKVFDSWRIETSSGSVYDGTWDLTTSAGGTYKLCASWRYKRCKILFDMQGVNVATPNSIYKTFDTNVTLPTPDSSTVPVGYTFVGWYKEPGCINKYTGTTELTNQDDAEVTLYAKWAVQLVVIFNSNGKGAAPDPKDVVSGEEIELPNIHFDGYTIEGWYKNSDCQNIDRVGAPGNAYTVTGTITLYANWKPIHYTIKLNPNTSWQTCAASTSEVTINCEYGQDIVLSNPGFTSDGYSLAGWSSTNGKNNAVEHNIGDTVSNLRTQEGEWITFYAKWVPGAYYVVFDGNGATEGSMGNQTIEVGQSANLTQNAYTKTGHHFVGWTESQDGTGTVYTDKASYNKVGAQKDQSYTLYAKWAPNTYTIKYNIPQDYKLDSTYNIPNTNATYGQNVTLPTVDNSKIKYATFDKWVFNNVEYNEGQVLTSPNFTSENNGVVTVDATFTNYKFKIRFHKTTPSMAEETSIVGSDISDIENINYRSNTDNSFTNITMPDISNWILDGYTFMGWALTEQDAKNSTLKINNQNRLTNDFINTIGITLTDNQTIDLYSVWVIYTPSAPSQPQQQPYYGGGGSSGGGGGSVSSNIQTSQTQTSQTQTQQAESRSERYNGPTSLFAKESVKDVHVVTNPDGSMSAVSDSKGVLDGWQKIQVDGSDKIFFFTEDKKLYTGFVQGTDGEFYHLNDQTGELDRENIIVNGVPIQIDENGKFVGDKQMLMQLDVGMLETYSGSWDYDPITNTWKYQMKNFDKEVKAQADSGLYEINGEHYVFDVNGMMLTGYQAIGDKIYYFKEDGDDKGKLLQEVKIENEDIQFVNADIKDAKTPKMTGMKS